MYMSCQNCRLSSSFDICRKRLLIDHVCASNTQLYIVHEFRGSLKHSGREQEKFICIINDTLSKFISKTSFE